MIKYRVFYETTYMWNGEITDKRVDTLGTIYAASGEQAISKAQYRAKLDGIPLPRLDTCENGGQGYERTSILKAERITE